MTKGIVMDKIQEQYNMFANTDINTIEFIFCINALFKIKLLGAGLV